MGVQRPSPTHEHSPTIPLPRYPPSLHTPTLPPTSQHNLLYTPPYTRQLSPPLQTNITEGKASQNYNQNSSVV